MPLTLTQAGKATGRNRTTILRAVRAGKLSATHDEATGAWLIEPAELYRLYPPLDAHASVPQDDAHLRNGHASAEIRELRARLEAAERRVADKDALITVHEAVIADLRQQRDVEAEERRRLTMVLADLRARSETVATSAAAPPPRRPWWRWGQR